MDTPFHVGAQILFDRARSLREAARMACANARAARACRDRPRSAGVVDDARHVRTRIDFFAGDGHVLVEVAGVVDIASRSELTDALTGAADSEEPVVVVDMSAVTLLAAAGIGCLAHAGGALAARGGNLHLVYPAGGPAARVLRVLDLQDRWRVHGDLPTALAAIRSRG